MSPEELALDPTYPFRSFAENTDEYYKSKAFWDSAFNSAGNNLDLWQNWMQDPLMDGHPILSKITPFGRRGVVVQQVNRSDDPAWFKCWVNDFGDEIDGGRIQYLFVETFISLPSAKQFSSIVKSWCHDLVNRSAMDRITAAVRIRSANDWALINFD